MNSSEFVLEGPELRLGPLDTEHLDLYISWLNDPVVNKNLGPVIGSLFTREKGEEWYEELKEQEDKRVFTLYREENEDKPIGYCGLYGLDHRNKRGTVQVIIGEAECRGRGFGTEATKLLLDYGFSFLDLHTVSLSLMEGNKGARRVPEKLGFNEAGRLRDFWALNGKYYDKILMDITREEFYAKNDFRVASNYLQEG